MPPQLQHMGKQALNLPEQHNRADPVGRGLDGQPQEHECGRAGPTTCLLYSDMCKEEMIPSTPRPLPHTSDRRVGPEVIGAGELALSSTYWNSQNIEPCT